METVIEKPQEKTFRNERPKEKRINLYINPIREQRLKELCGYIGADPSRVDDNDSELIWDLLTFMTPVLKLRHKIVDDAKAAGLRSIDLV